MSIVMHLMNECTTHIKIDAPIEIHWNRMEFLEQESNSEILYSLCFLL